MGEESYLLGLLESTFGYWWDEFFLGQVQLLFRTVSFFFYHSLENKDVIKAEIPEVYIAMLWSTKIHSQRSSQKSCDTLTEELFRAPQSFTAQNLARSKMMVTKSCKILVPPSWISQDFSTAIFDCLRFCAWPN